MHKRVEEEERETRKNRRTKKNNPSTRLMNPGESFASSPLLLFFTIRGNQVMSDVPAGSFFFSSSFFCCCCMDSSWGGGGCKFGRLIKEGAGAWDKWCL
ncbi:uncharacterized protein TRIVIDRAFT_179794 [Trichoderma virens Gv29-8]|uniref:Uncharacterized protein n=1 Tax=Hypocrea virens (strain Gv29-8 / FGSC 10586) TaxID=413071 RepID=G9MTV1_HYPVG|nr:uncharacterized protein TRIVIDRAFT_179794 [Trichoderma virens Gv29-8]EHK22449.1 hypothetical protein TRIVIDRAFT_91475 [Trichoderma virens Gv29-8]